MSINRPLKDLKNLNPKTVIRRYNNMRGAKPVMLKSLEKSDVFYYRPLGTTNYDYYIYLRNINGSSFSCLNTRTGEIVSIENVKVVFSESEVIIPRKAEEKTKPSTEANLLDGVYIRKGSIEARVDSLLLGTAFYATQEVIGAYVKRGMYLVLIVKNNKSTAKCIDLYSGSFYNINLNAKVIISDIAEINSVVKELSPKPKGEVTTTDSCCKKPMESSDDKNILKTGSKVILKSGGPMMTVSKINDNNAVHCRWFVNGIDQMSVFCEEVLIKIN